MYRALGNSANNSKCDATIIMDSNWWIYKYFNTYKGDILKAYCYALNMGKSEEHYHNRCEFLYYWIIDKIKEHLGNDYSLNATALVSSVLKNLGHGWECTNIYPNISRNLFEYGKKVFDFSVDHETIKGQLEKSSGKCSGEYYKYLKAVKTAYQGIQSIYNYSKEPYCAHLIGEYKRYFDEDGDLELEYGEATELERVSVKKEEDKEEAQDKDDENEEEEGDTVSTALTIVGVGLPAILFFLYKHTPIFSRIRNHFGNNSVGRRIKSIERRYNMERENSTEGSSILGSTIEYSNSDLAESVTDHFTVYSVPYIR
ncbi:hypothetical protein PCYB_002480 [Plasmodium cynomolgi strain B]|uniref:CYIR protein n=1 Tax=Plasmodium cynomolgi (strain B) TaxID=1120755 RepID=K6UZU0_PLACD|nr:hypothetical protein PCYB_002480 [Plasmodium cynomolgi strain B]GAB69499.1 hypothetical protein PCYB_002480 [Plasmodium cynomolgi strain B]